MIGRHLLPGFMSHIIVTITLAIPGMILAETALSFLGLGLRPPVTSWGVLLQEAQNVRTVALHPWLMLPVLFVIVAVLAFNFVGDACATPPTPTPGSAPKPPPYGRLNRRTATDYSPLSGNRKSAGVGAPL